MFCYFVAVGIYVFSNIYDFKSLVEYKKTVSGEIIWRCIELCVSKLKMEGGQGVCQGIDFLIIYFYEENTKVFLFEYYYFSFESLVGANFGNP